MVAVLRTVIESRMGIRIGVSLLKSRAAVDSRQKRLELIKIDRFGYEKIPSGLYGRLMVREAAVGT